jgi:hypothetical protein
MCDKSSQSSTPPIMSSLSPAVEDGADDPGEQEHDLVVFGPVPERGFPEAAHVCWLHREICSRVRQAPSLGSFRADCSRTASASNSGVVCGSGGGQAVQLSDKRMEGGGCVGEEASAAEQRPAGRLTRDSSGRAPSSDAVEKVEHTCSSLLSQRYGAFSSLGMVPSC